jgi:hypothetical protein
MHQPQIITYFKNELNKLNGDDVGVILKKQPQLKPYFENIKSNG